MKQTILYILLVALLLIACVPITPTATPTPPPGTPVPAVNLLANPNMTFMAGHPVVECSQGVLCAAFPYWYPLTYPKAQGTISVWPDLALDEPTSFVAEYKYEANTPVPWRYFLIPLFESTANEVKVESERAAFALQQSGQVTVQIGQEYYIDFHVTPLILAEQPSAEWLPGNTTLYLQALAAGEVPPLEFVRPSQHGAGWSDTAIWRILVLPDTPGGAPYHDSGWFDGFSVSAQTGNEGYTVGFGDYVTFDTFFTPDETHCTGGPTCPVTVVLEMAVRDVNGVVPYLGSMYVHAAQMVAVP